MTGTNPLTAAARKMTVAQIHSALAALEDQRVLIEWETTLYQAALELKRRDGSEKERAGDSESSVETTEETQTEVLDVPKKRGRPPGSKNKTSGARREIPNRGRAAIRSVMAATPERIWSVDDVTDEMIKRNWSPSNRHGVQVTLSRMYQDGELARPKPSTFKLIPPEGAKPDETGAG